MKTILSRCAAVAGLLLGLGLHPLRADDKAGQLAVIVNKASKLDNVPLGDLNKYYTAVKLKDPSGAKLVLVMQDAGRPEREALLKQVCKQSQSEYDAVIAEAIFTGAISAAPKSLPTGAAVKAFVAQTPGALGYVRASEADDTVSVLKIDGKVPGEPGYPLTLK